MKAILVKEGGALSYEDFDDPVAGPGEVVVELKAAAINRRDLLVRNPPGPAYEFDLPLVPGSDGAGIRRDTGEEVVIYPGLHWGKREDAAGPDWQILGGPRIPLHEMVKIDHLYVANWSLWLDLKIMLRTVPHVLRRGGQ